MHAPGITEVDNQILVAWMANEGRDYDDTD